MKVKVQKLLNSIKADDALYDSKLMYLQYLKDLKKNLRIGEKMIVIDLDEKDTAHDCDEMLSIIKYVMKVSVIRFNTNNVRSRVIHHLNNLNGDDFVVIGNPYDNTNVLLAKGE